MLIQRSKIFIMNPSQFALAVVFPGADVADVVRAAMQRNVHIVDKEPYKEHKNYASFDLTYQPYLDGGRILLLFVFPGGYSVLAKDQQTLNNALNTVQQYSN